MLQTLRKQQRTQSLIFLDAIGTDPTKARKIPEPYSMHTGFNPSKSGFIQQHLEDCGPMHNVSSNINIIFHASLTSLQSVLPEIPYALPASARQCPKYLQQLLLRLAIEQHFNTVCFKNARLLV